MRFRLRTLVILTAIGPPLLALLNWIFTNSSPPVRVVAFSVSFYTVLFTWMGRHHYQQTKSTAVARWRAEREAAGKHEDSTI